MQQLLQKLKGQLEELHEMLGVWLKSRNVVLEKAD